MNGNFWDNDTPSEWETIEETIEDQAQAVLDEFEDDEEDDYEEEYEEDDEELMDDYRPTKGKSAYRLDERESTVLSDATIRLEQARLYDMLIKHDLFAGVKAHPAALRNVQNELKQYIVSRLEILLGIKQEKVQKEEKKQVIVESPFNDVEIEFLKALSYKGTKGASAQAKPKHLIANEIQSLSDKVQETSGLRPMARQESIAPLKPMQHESYEEEEGEPVRKKATPQPKPKPQPQVQKKSAPKKKPGRPRKKAAPAKQNNTSSTKSYKRTRKGEMSDAEAEAIAREELKSQGSGLGKHPYEMTPKELLEASKRSAKRSANKPSNALPIPNSEQLGLHYQTQQLNNSTKPGNAGVSLLVQKILHDKSNK